MIIQPYFQDHFLDTARSIKTSASMQVISILFSIYQVFDFRHISCVEEKYHVPEN